MHAGMITREDELTIGRELWHVYGHLGRAATRIIVDSEVRKSERYGPDLRYVRVRYHLPDGKTTYGGCIFVGDVGIGENHNMNRLFETEAQALAFYDSDECVEYRTRTGYYDDFYDPDECVEYR